MEIVDLCDDTFERRALEHKRESIKAGKIYFPEFAINGPFAQADQV